MEIKKGKLSTSHRYDLLPLLRSSPGGIRRELVVYDFPDCKYSYFLIFYKKILQSVPSDMPGGTLCKRHILICVLILRTGVADVVRLVITT